MNSTTDPTAWPHVSGVYVISFGDGRYYGGRARFIDMRWRAHLATLRSGVSHNAGMQTAYRETGGVFVPWLCVQGPQYGVDQDLLPTLEQAWLIKWGGTPGCLNLSPQASAVTRGKVEEAQAWLLREGKEQVLAASLWAPPQGEILGDWAPTRFPSEPPGARLRPIRHGVILTDPLLQG